MACQKVRSSSSSRKLALLLLHTGVVLLVLALPVGGEAGRTDPMPDTSTFTDVEESSDVSSLDMDSFCKGMPMVSPSLPKEPPLRPCHVGSSPSHALTYYAVVTPTLDRKSVGVTSRW